MTPGRPPVEVVVSVDDIDSPPPPAHLADLAGFVLDAEGVAGPAEMGLVFVDRAAIAELNATYRGKDSPTDVLSFPIDDDPDNDVLPHGEAGPRLVGDVVICRSVAAANAPDHAGTEQAELELLVTHGVLHLLGWDHEEIADAVAMQTRERELLDAWAHRTGGATPRPETWADPTDDGIRP